MRTFLISMIFSAVAMGVTANEMCDTVSRGNSFLGDSCYDVVESGLFNGAAVELCAPLARTNSYLAIECLKAIKLKKYSGGEIDRCTRSRNNAYLLIQCLEKAGDDACR